MYVFGYSLSFVFCFVCCRWQSFSDQDIQIQSVRFEIWLFFLNLITCLERKITKVFFSFFFFWNYKKVWSSLKAVVELVWASEHDVCHHIIRPPRPALLSARLGLLTGACVRVPPLKCYKRGLWVRDPKQITAHKLRTADPDRQQIKIIKMSHETFIIFILRNINKHFRVRVFCCLFVVIIVDSGGF